MITTRSAAQARRQLSPNDFVEQFYVASAHSYVLVFTDRGHCYWLKVHHAQDFRSHAVR